MAAKLDLFQRECLQADRLVIPEHKEAFMAAMKPRTGDGPMEAVREGRVIIVRVPLEGGGRLVVSLNDQEATDLREVLNGVVG